MRSTGLGGRTPPMPNGWTTLPLVLEGHEHRAGQRTCRGQTEGRTPLARAP